MRNFKTEGIIIKRRNFQDQDRILTIFTPFNGKISVRGTGVRKITSRRSGHIELLNHSMLTLYQGKSFPVLTEAATINNFSEIKKDLDTMGFAYHICELVDGLCPENQENVQVFSLLKDTLMSLEADLDKRSIVNEFEMKLLAMLGFWNKVDYAQVFDTQSFIENILERRLKSRRIFTKIN